LVSASAYEELRALPGFIAEIRVTGQIAGPRQFDQRARGAGARAIDFDYSAQHHEHDVGRRSLAEQRRTLRIAHQRMAAEESPDDILRQPAAFEPREQTIMPLGEPLSLQFTFHAWH